MNKAASSSEQCAVIRDLNARYAAMNMHLCVAGCGTPIWAGKRCCDRCQQEIDALDRMAWERSARRQKRGEQLRAMLAAALDLLDRLRKVDWITVAILTGGVIAASVCAFDFGKAFAEWWMTSCK